MKNPTNYPLLFAASLLMLTSSLAWGDAAAPPQRPGPPKLSPDPSPTAQAHLDSVNAALIIAQNALGRATTDNHGGFVEKAAADVKKALDDEAQATAYLKAHADENKLATGPAPADSSAPGFAKIPGNVNSRRPGGTRGDTAQTNMIAAVDSLNAALNELLNSSATSSQPPILGDLGGYRKKLLDDINQANTDVLAGIATGNGQTVTPPMPPAPATSTATPDKSLPTQASNTPTPANSIVASVALSLGLSLGGLRLFARKKHR
ncbi:MAG TPA: hypothetical protein VK737_04370 [Opitutales bacterium]|nr:hypothetical protein [Opitutales bacterium]